jgi:hypothetical protein
MNPPPPPPPPPPIDIDDDDDKPINPALLADLKARLGNAEIEFREDAGFEGDAQFRVLMGNGRDKRTLVLRSDRQFERLLSIEFEKFTFLSDYEAIVSYRDDEIEALVRPLSRNFTSTEILKRRLFGTLANEIKGDSITLLAEGVHATESITLGPSSRELRTFLEVPDLRFSKPLSIRLKGFRVNGHDAALHTLERIAQNIFFQIDSQLGLSLGLGRNRPTVGPSSALLRLRTKGILAFPETEYDREPITLYFYGRAASGLPLLQFLAFYQVLEFFFPVYSESDAKRRLQQILKTPGFSCHRDSDVMKLVHALRSRATRGFGDEKSQLRSSINAVIEIDDLKEFFEAIPERCEFFAKAKSVSKIKIPLGNPNHDFRAEVAERIYDIRCKIVHSKNDDREGPDYLLPYSKEAESLTHDIELVRLIAQRAIIASGQQMR